MKTLTLRPAHAIAALAVLVAALGAQPLSAAEADARLDRLERAASTGAVGTLHQIRAELAARLEGPDATTLDRYNLAYVDWRIGSQVTEQPSAEEERDEILAEAQAHLEAVIEAEPDNAEALALLGGVLGLQIGTSARRGMTLGPKSSAAIKEAAQLEPDNPRVALQQGISFFHTPRMWGGGAAKAERELRRATELFATQPEGSPWPSWGHLDALTWLGQTLARRGKTDEARAVYEEVLRLEPDMSWVRFVLLPALDKKTSRR